MEAEVVVDLKPAEFTQKVNMSIIVDQARGILENMEINLPARIAGGDVNALLESTPKLTKDQVSQFYEEAAALNAKY